MKPTHAAAIVAAGALTVFATARLVSATRQLLGPLRVYSGSVELGRSLAGVVARNASDGSLLDLGTVSDAIVMVFEPDCEPCGANMPNWIDLLEATQRDSLPALALGMGAPEPRRDYWRALARRVAVYVADSAAIVKGGFRSTPTTVLVRDGNVVVEFVGVLNHRERELVVEEFRSGRAEPARATRGSDRPR